MLSREVDCFVGNGLTKHPCLSILECACGNHESNEDIVKEAK